MSTTDTEARLTDEERAELLAVAEKLAQPDGPLLDERDSEVVEAVDRMASLVE